MRLLAIVLAAAVIPSSVFAQDTASRDAAELRRLIEVTAQAINAHDPDGVLAHYSKDVIVSYPNVPDTTYEMFAKSYREMMNPGVVTQTAPQVDEVIVSGDLAIIRMSWSTTITEKATGQKSSRQAKDLQVWRREGGAWKFYRGMWHHVAPPKP